MPEIEIEVVTLDDFDGDEGDARELVLEFARRTEDAEPKRTRVLDEEGGVARDEVRGRTRRSQIPWDSIAVLLMSSPQTVLDLLAWAAEYPGLTIGYSTMDGARLKVFPDNSLVSIENVLNIEINRVGSYAEDKSVVVVSEEDWIEIQDARARGDLDVDVPEENDIGP